MTSSDERISHMPTLSDLIATKARELNLGAPQGDSPVPQRAPQAALKATKGHAEGAPQV
jgi:hypothetical protein